MSQFQQRMEKKKPIISFSLFSTLTETFSMEKPITKSPRNFENSGGVGLGIVAAMTISNNNSNTQESVFNLTVSPRSNPVPIVSFVKPAANFHQRGVGLLHYYGDDEESDESYTCVISHVGNNVAKKCVYYGDKFGGFCEEDLGSGGGSVVDVNCGLFYASSSPFTKAINADVGENRREFWSRDFLTSCYLCNKLLHGLDIFMYRGEKAFCSAECRDKQIRNEDYKDKCSCEARKPHDCSISPLSSPQVFFAGVAAA